MEVRFIKEEELMNFFSLYVTMMQGINKGMTQFRALNEIVREINNQMDFIAVGLFENDELVGFMTGHCLLKKQFHFSGIYVKIKNNLGLKTLIDFSLDYARKQGYSAWTSDATNSNISSIMEKYGAKSQYTRFIGEL